MSRNIITVISSKIERKFNELLKIFHIKEVDLKHSEFDIKSLFRGFSKDDPKKTCLHTSFTKWKYSKVCARK